MIKLSVFLTRRQDLTHEDFVTYWTQKHTPLIGSLPTGDVPVRRYVQLYPTPDSTPGFSPTGYDGVAELWVDSSDDATSWFTSDTYARVVVPDEEKVLDRTKTRFLYATEAVIFG